MVCSVRGLGQSFSFGDIIYAQSYIDRVASYSYSHPP